jgi:hypothetical protein
MERIDGILKNLVKSLGIEREIKKKDILQLWNQIAEELNIKGAKALYMKGNILWIGVERAGERQEIMMKKFNILESYRKRGIKIRDVKFVREREK